ncbi:MAG: dihydropteroate synthase [Planctomycetia bacterium]|nr:dihydropteroate synthase [Planctomycetia bacterium]
MTHWQVGAKCLNFDKRPLFMGILNATPDSFSDGGQFVTADASGHVVDFNLDLLAAQAFRLAHAGADLLDLGGMSTAPGAAEVSVAEELHRITSVLPALREASDLPLSIDTYRAEVADVACRLGASIVNDISGGTFDSDMADVVRRHGAGVCLGHIQGTPQTMQTQPHYDNVVDEVYSALAAARDAFVRAGVPQAAICLDPGLGFGKSLRHNIALVRHIDRFLDLGQPLLVGHSRKRMITELAQRLRPGAATEELARLKDEISVRVARTLVRGGVHILRVHDVQLHASVVSGGDS